MSDTRTPDAFFQIIDAFTAPARDAFAAHLDALEPALDAAESDLLCRVAADALNDSARRKLNRVLLLELHAARLSGDLRATDDADQFAEFIEYARRPAFADHLRRRYPALETRLTRVLSLKRAALEALVVRGIADRPQLAALLGQSAGRMTALELGQGDHHHGGQTVAQVAFEGGRVMYKPRSLRVDRAFEGFLARVFVDLEDRIRVPAVLDRGDYGWTEFVPDRYCATHEELDAFYVRLGHWLAVLRLLGGTDVHQENLIAAGPVPVAIDVESLFAIEAPIVPSGQGQAFDLASALVRASVLRTGIMPFRAPVLGLANVDISAAGALPGEQPKIRVPMIADEGTMAARLYVASVDLDSAKNHPSPVPDVSKYWDRITEGFLDGTARLARLDRDGALAPLLADFHGCPVRDIRRPTQTYVEITRMLWHPASLHDEAAAMARASDLLRRNAAVLPIAPSTPEEIAAEIDDMRQGDVPMFVAPLDQARIDATLADWRAMRVEIEELTIRGALVTVYLNERLGKPHDGSGADVRARAPHANRLDVRRRALAAQAVERLRHLAVRGDDGTVTWISPELGDNGWDISPLQPDVYAGLGGVAVTLTGYRDDMRAGRVDEVEGLDALLDGTLDMLRAMEAAETPTSVGGLIGLASQVWTWLTLHDLLDRPDMLTRAVQRAELLERLGFEHDRDLDILEGASGAIVPLLHLADATGDERWRVLAARAGRHLEAHAIVDARGARWPSAIFPEPIGGFAHGATGIGWSLLRLVLDDAGDDDDRARWRRLAAQAFAFQETLYDAEVGNWADARQPGAGVFLHTWCHGSTGIGLAAADLYARTRDPQYLHTLRRAAATAGRHGWGTSHTLCHGDFSLWELLMRHAALDPDAVDVDTTVHSAEIVSALEEHDGAVGSQARDAFTPGLMIGVAGAIHFLNRMHPDCRVPSPLLLDRRRASQPSAKAFQETGRHVDDIRTHAGSQVIRSTA